MRTGPKLHEKIEFFFDIFYLLFAILAAAVFFSAAAGRTPLLLLGSMALTLALGDAFHLLPRLAVIATGNKLLYHKALGRGKQITSIGMTLFYLLLFALWQKLYPTLTIPSFIAPLLLGLAAIRILLCLLPQNGWITGNATLHLAFWRNLPFVFIGIILIALFWLSSTQTPDAFGCMPLAIFLSFGFYLPVALAGSQYPALGALMLPKTVMYIWILCMGFSLLPY